MKGSRPFLGKLMECMEFVKLGFYNLLLQNATKKMVSLVLRLRLFLFLFYRNFCNALRIPFTASVVAFNLIVPQLILFMIELNFIL